MNTVTIACLTEGKTDDRFLLGIIARTFESILLKAPGEIMVMEPQFFGKSSTKGVEDIVDQMDGYDIICIHADTDNLSPQQAIQQRIQPVINTIRNKGNTSCIVPIMPIRMTEAWMLADKDAFIEELDTEKSYADLNISSNIENIADPKQIIIEAIRIVDADLPKKERGQVDISDLYTVLALSSQLSELERLSSYQTFVEDVVTCLKHLNFI